MCVLHEYTMPKIDISKNILTRAQVDHLVVGDVEAAAYGRGAQSFDEARAVSQEAIRDRRRTVRIRARVFVRLDRAACGPRAAIRGRTLPWCARARRAALLTMSG